MHIIRFFTQLAAFMAGGLSLCAPASAETLTIAGVYPAANDQAAAMQSIVIDRFDGMDGPALSLRIEYVLGGVQIQGQPWFAILPASVRNDGDALLRGHAAADVRNDPIRLTRERCVARDEDRRCTERKQVEVDCINRTVWLDYTIRLTGFDGRSIHMGDDRKEQQLSYCPDDDSGTKTVETTVRELVDQAASDVRYALAPTYRVDKIRVHENRKVLKGQLNKDFVAALKLTKTNEDAACDQWAAINSAEPTHLATVFNMGLCAEMRGDLEGARRHYEYALQISPKEKYPTSGMQRLNSRQRALWQIDAHNGN